MWQFVKLCGSRLLWRAQSSHQPRHKASEFNTALAVEVPDLKLSHRLRSACATTARSVATLAHYRGRSDWRARDVI